jgi:DNA-binding transcriptional LysR family regulator
METNRLVQFRTVVETGNLRKAAALLGISHSGLSKSLKVLEDEVGYALFEPHGRGVVVSDAGRALYQRCEAVLRALDRMLGRGEAETERPLRLGSFEVFTSYFIGELLARYLPGRGVEVHELVPGRLEEALILDKVDVGVTYEPMPRPGIDYVEVTRIVMNAYAREGAFGGEDVLRVPFVTPVSPLEGAPSGVKGRDGWPDERFRRDIRYRVDLMTTGLELVGRGLCAIFIPEFVARLHNARAPEGLRVAPLPLPKGMGEVRRNVFLVRRQSTPEDATVRAIARALREVCQAA